MQSERWLSFLGLIRKAGKISLGEQNTGNAVRQKKARLIIVAEDASPNALKRAQSFAASSGCALLNVPADKNTLGEALGSSPFAMAAICDSGFADAFHSIINQCD